MHTGTAYNKKGQGSDAKGFAEGDQGKKKRALISIVIPVLEEEKILEETLQSYPKDLLKRCGAELIVSDGGSKDNSVEIARKYADKLVVHDKDYRQTISEGRNCGAAVADGECLVFINGDTVPKDTEDFLGKIRALYEGCAETEWSAIACPVNVRPEERLTRDKIFYVLHNMYVRLLNKIGMGMGRGECQIVRSEVFRKVGGYNGSIAAGEDFDLYNRISKRGRIKFAEDIVVYESPRRFRKYGYIRILTSWSLNSLSVMFRGKSVSKEWEAVR